MKLRHALYNSGFKKSASFNLPVICVGNLSLGGTGKTPMAEYLIRLIKKDHHPAIISRGYKRRTKGYLLADENTTATEIGDEPMQFHMKFPDVPVAVGEERALALPQLLYDRPDVDVVVLDDAFQHRKISAGLNILLTQYGKLFTDDSIFPVGSLRDESVAAKRADIIIVTKCPESLAAKERDDIKKKISRYSKADVYFSTLMYGHPENAVSKESLDLSAFQNCIVLTGIEDPTVIYDFLHNQGIDFTPLKFPDHHNFTSKDLESIRSKAGDPNRPVKILTTEKDLARLLRFKNELTGLPLYTLPVYHLFLFNEEQEFDGKVLQFVKRFKERLNGKE